MSTARAWADPLVLVKPRPRFERRQFRLGGRTYPYQVAFPVAWSERARWPLIVFLHGGGERGEDGFAPVSLGLAPVLRRHPERFPAVAVFPQCPAGRWWMDDEVALVVLAVV